MDDLVINNLNKIIGKKRILDDVSFSIKKGDIVGIVGQNGAGKTTIIKCITGLYKPTSGDIKICGYDIKTNFEEVMSKMGCIVENPDMYNNLSGWKNLKIYSLLYGNFKEEYLKELISEVKLEKRIYDKVKTYSLGMKQRLGLVQALMNEPKILILDEPTNGLDPVGIIELREIILKLKKERNITIFIASHILTELENICDEFIMIDNGKIIDKIDSATLKENKQSLEDFFKSNKKIEEGQIK